MVKAFFKTATLQNVADGSIRGVSAPIIVAADLTIADSGRIFTLSNAGLAYSISVPPPTTAGIFYKFHLVATPAAIISITCVTASSMKGFLISSAGIAALSVAAAGLGSAAAYTQVRFSVTATAGDYLTMESDGLVWRCFGQSGAAAGLLFA